MHNDSSTAIRDARSAALLVEADPAVVEEAGKPVPTREHVVDRLGDDGLRRDAASCCSSQVLSADEWFALFLAHGAALIGAFATDLVSIA